MIRGFSLLVLLPLLAGMLPAANEGTTAPDNRDVAALLKSLKGPDPEERRAALRKLRRSAIDQEFGELKMDVIRACVKLMAEDGNNDVRSEACDVLSWTDADAAPLLIEALLSEDPNTQARGARALTGIAPRSGDRLGELDPAIPHLAKLMRSEEMAPRLNAAAALARLGPEALPHLIGALDAKGIYQDTLLRGFLRHGENSIAPLCAALQTGNLPTRQNAGQALFMMSWKASDAFAAKKETALKALTAAIGDEDGLTRSRAIDALGRMGPLANPALDKIVAALKQDDAPLLSIAEAVHRIGPRADQFELLVEGAAKIDRDTPVGRASGVARQFGKALAGTGEDIVGKIAPLLDDPRESVSEAGLFALFELGKAASPAVPALIERMNAGDTFAVQILGVIGPEAEAAIPHLIRQLEKGQWYRPRLIMPKHFPQHPSVFSDALAEIGPSAVPALLENLSHKNDLVIAGCLEALRKMRDEELDLKKVEPLCHHKHPVNRGLAFRVIASRFDKKQEEVVALLNKLNANQNAEVAEAAGAYLEMLKRPNVKRDTLGRF